MNTHIYQKISAAKILVYMDNGKAYIRTGNGLGSIRYHQTICGGKPRSLRACEKEFHGVSNPPLKWWA